MRDEISSLDKHKDHNIILNLETSKNKGSDWNSLYKKGEKAYYFSSYALPPVSEIKELTSNCSDRWYNIHQIQDFGQKYCGQAALFILYQLVNGVSFETTILECRK